jgi:hypothetical protein
LPVPRSHAPVGGSGGNSLSSSGYEAVGYFEDSGEFDGSARSPAAGRQVEDDT